MRDGIRAHSRKLRGFSLAELLVATTISALVLGAVIMLMGQGLEMVETNAAYSEAQRGALSVIEFLPKEIAYASRVEIISDPGHAITDDLLSQDWHYIVRTNGGVRHLYWDWGHGKRGEEPIPGSEFVTNLKFGADVFSPDKYGGGRVALFRVEAQKDKKNVVLERSRLVHALEGVMGEDNVSLNAAFPGGSILRYKIPAPDTSVEVNLFGSLNTEDEPPLFDYLKPDTWGRVKHYTTVTKIDATLKLSEDALNQLDPAELPVFTWIVAQTDSFFSNYPELSGDLFDTLEKTEKQEKLLRVLREDNYLKSRLEDRTVGKRATADPAKLEGTPFNQGYQILEVSRGAQVSTDTYGTESYLDLGGIVNTLLSRPGAYQGAHLIAVAHYKGKDGTWNMASSFAALGEEHSSGNLWERVID
ncbi:MAG: prepilin-type N-terminal cleavage/methylation domain-containing protein, partial [Synergistaceae bacterium]|nr:prepilin-type N-terminal cleavage/methylation domain-containing protein [Synergistaceae bacterium]